MSPTETSVDPKPGKDDRRDAIIAIAQETFASHGYAGTSMSAIAARLGGSKGTLYNYFKSKDDLFAAYVQRHCVWQSEAMFALLEDTGDVYETLKSLGRRHLEMVLSEDNIRRFRVITAEAERAPEVGRIFYESGPLNGATRLAAYLAKAAARGQLRIEDPLQAAFDMMALSSFRIHRARVCNVIPQPTAAEIDREVDRAMRAFLAIYGPPAKSRA